MLNYVYHKQNLRIKMPFELEGISMILPMFFFLDNRTIFNHKIRVATIFRK